MAELTLRRLRNTDFHELYSKLLLRQELGESELSKLLQISVVLLNSENDEIKKLGHRIVLQYSNITGDLIPLYDLSVNLGHIPVAKLVERNLGNDVFKERFFREFQTCFQEIYKDGDKYLTEEQQMMKAEFKQNIQESSRAVIAPTSYGKTELVLSTLSANQNILIMVPTKALLSQTKARILKSSEYQINRKIITHNEMYGENDTNFVAILTQERTIKILQKNPNISFDIAFVDEAHNLLEDNSRSRLMAAAIMMLKSRNEEISINYLSPFLFDHKSLKLSYADIEVKELRVKEFVKSEMVYLCDMRRGGTTLELYDQYLDSFVDVPGAEYPTDVDLIKAKAKNKNIVYINKPVDIEHFVGRVLPTFEVLEDAEIETACTSISDYLHEEYSLVNCLKHGIVFHHGSVPDNVKLYIEYLYSKISALKYIVTTSTLLEGVNIPARTLFLLSDKRGPRKLSASQFKNLIGRVCRFSEIFDPLVGNVEMLSPEVYVIGTEYTDERSNLRTFLKSTLKADKKASDEPENILLTETELDADKRREKREFESYLENIEPGLTGSTRDVSAETDFGRFCYENNVFEFDVSEKEEDGQEAVDRLLNRRLQISNTEELFETINEVFIQLIEDNSKNRNILRLRDLGARNFYKMLVDWKLNNTAYKQMIFSMLNYWQGREATGNYFIYAGKWGDTQGDDDEFATNWVDLREKNQHDRINLAIVRIKDEQDFLENSLFKFMDILNELDLFDDEFYLKIKFGTSDENKIAMIRNGFSLTLSNLLLTRYANFVTVNRANETVLLNRAVLEEMERNNENQVIIHEARLNVGR